MNLFWASNKSTSCRPCGASNSLTSPTCLTQVTPCCESKAADFQTYPDMWMTCSGFSFTSIANQATSSQEEPTAPAIYASRVVHNALSSDLLKVFQRLSGNHHHHHKTNPKSQKRLRNRTAGLATNEKNAPCATRATP